MAKADNDNRPSDRPIGIPDAGAGPDEQAVARLAQLAGLDLPPSDLPPLTRALRSHLNLITALEALDLERIETSGSCNPRWDD